MALRKNQDSDENENAGMHGSIATIPFVSQ